MIFTGSRYSKTKVYKRNGAVIFKNRATASFDEKKCTLYTFCTGDTLDVLASKYYNDSNLWWVILDANPKYYTELDIVVGDSILIPNKAEVVSYLAK